MIEAGNIRELDKSISQVFDKIYHVDNRFINRDTLEDQRLFSLSDYGFYMLTFKLSVHFSRIQEKVNRSSIAN